MKTTTPILWMAFAFVLLQINTAYAQKNEKNKLPFTANPTLQHTTLVVSDFSKSKHFYTELLGFSELEAPWLPNNQMFIALGDNLELHMGEVAGVAINPSTFNHFAFSVADLDAFLSYLKLNGIVYQSLGGGNEYSVYTRPDGVRQTFFQDPDGYWLEVNDKQ